MTKDVGYDALEQDLRAALAEDAAAIAPGEALGSILARTCLLYTSTSTLIVGSFRPGRPRPVRRRRRSR